MRATRSRAGDILRFCVNRRGVALHRRDVCETESLELQPEAS